MSDGSSNISRVKEVTSSESAEPPSWYGFIPLA